VITFSFLAADIDGENRLAIAATASRVLDLRNIPFMPVS
jgi:hypothetical protein